MSARELMLVGRAGELGTLGWEPGSGAVEGRGTIVCGREVVGRGV